MVEIRSTPSPLLLLSDRMKKASDDLERDTLEIQYLLSQFGDAVSGEETDQAIRNAQRDIAHCKHLCHELSKISSDLQEIRKAYLAEETTMMNRINESLRNMA